MTKKATNNQYVIRFLVYLGSKGMSQGMRCDLFLPAQFTPSIPHFCLNGNGSNTTCLFCGQKVIRIKFPLFEIDRQNVAKCRGNWNLSELATFGISNV
jgi:hypothetical protein